MSDLKHGSDVSSMQTSPSTIPNAHKLTEVPDLNLDLKNTFILPEKPTTIELKCHEDNMDVMVSNPIELKFKRQNIEAVSPANKLDTVTVEKSNHIANLIAHIDESIDVYAGSDHHGDQSDHDVMFFVFISDEDIPEKLADQLKEYGNLKSFTDNPELFANRDFKYLRHADVKSLWINLRNEKAKHWLQDNIKKDSAEYRFIATYKASKRSKWINQVKQILAASSRNLTAICRFKQLKEMRSLCLTELNDRINDGLIFIKTPPSRIMACLGCSSAVEKKA